MLKQYLNRFATNKKITQQDSQHPYAAPKYGNTIQFSPYIPETSENSDKENIFLEQVLGALLYYGMGIYCTMLVVINSIEGNKTYGMLATMDAVVQLLDYTATHPDAKATSHRSNMIKKHSNASYLSENQACRRVE